MTCAPPPGLPSYTSLPVFLSSKRAATQRFPSFGLPCSPTLPPGRPHSLTVTASCSPPS